MRGRRGKSGNREVMMRILTRRVRPTLNSVVESKFFLAKQWLLGAVESHPISQDINSHAPSRSLAGSKTGTLYGFIGFEEDSQSDPIGDLVAFLESEIQFIPNNRPRPGKLFSSSVVYPSKEAFNNENFRLSWISRGWPLLIEEGISGLPYYLNKKTKNGSSRSGEGFQADSPIRGGDWPGYPYLTPLIAEFRQKLLLR